MPSDCVSSIKEDRAPLNADNANRSYLMAKNEDLYKHEIKLQHIQAQAEYHRDINQQHMDAQWNMLAMLQAFHRNPRMTETMNNHVNNDDNASQSAFPHSLNAWRMPFKETTHDDQYDASGRELSSNSSSYGSNPILPSPYIGIPPHMMSNGMVPSNEAVAPYSGANNQKFQQPQPQSAFVRPTVTPALSPQRPTGNNRTGYEGVYYVKRAQSFKTCHYDHASGREVCKSFSLKKWGYATALEKAIRQREKWIEAGCLRPRRGAAFTNQKGWQSPAPSSPRRKMSLHEEALMNSQHMMYCKMPPMAAAHSRRKTFGLCQPPPHLRGEASEEPHTPNRPVLDENEEDLDSSRNSRGKRGIRGNGV